MSKLILAASVAALAIANPVFADKGGNGGDRGGGNGGDHGGDRGGQSASEDRGHGGGRGGEHGGQSKSDERGRGGGNGGGDRGGGDGGQFVRADQGRDHGGERSFERQARNGNREIETRSSGRGEQFRDAERARGDAFGGQPHERRQAARDFQHNDRGTFDNRANERGQFVTRDFNDGFRGVSNGCPPGLVRKDNGCLPPGQAARFLGARLQDNYANRQLPYQYRSWYRDDGDHFFRSGDGYIYRVNRSNDVVDGLIPLFGGDGYYALGDRWPDNYNFYNVPYQYRDYYADTGQYDYRYGDGAIYRVNNGSGLIDGIVALLAGDLGVGQQLPTGYDVYNVPFQYRDRYADTADNMYRYNDGYIYQVDPKTRLISAVIDAII